MLLVASAFAPISVMRTLAHGHSLNLPNALSAARIFSVPFLVVVLFTNFEGRLGVPKEVLGAAIFGLASLTDWLDGYLARSRNQITTFGQVLDPIADKLLTAAAFVSLVHMSLAPLWMVAVIIGREVLVTLLRAYAGANGVVIPASRLGKIKMASQVVAILALILGQREELRLLRVLGQTAMWVAVTTAIVSAAAYYRECSRMSVKLMSGH